MAKKVIAASICLTDIDKSRIKISDKNGKKYLDIVLIETTGKQSDWMINESVSEQERKDKKYGKTLGNGKNVGTAWGSSSKPTEYTPPPPSSDDLPY